MCVTSYRNRFTNGHAGHASSYTMQRFPRCYFTRAYFKRTPLPLSCLQGAAGCRRLKKGETSSDSSSGDLYLIRSPSETQTQQMHHADMMEKEQNVNGGLGTLDMRLREDQSEVLCVLATEPAVKEEVGGCADESLILGGEDGIPQRLGVHKNLKSRATGNVTQSALIRSEPNRLATVGNLKMPLLRDGHRCCRGTGDFDIAVEELKPEVRRDDCRLIDPRSQGNVHEAVAESHIFSRTHTAKLVSGEHAPSLSKDKLVHVIVAA
mmetsp:Transcript_38735/g.76145  ORF Transcript_38735/g.76145 Transcript_38735/m.76145 type:complete len:265 (-) Transcript_38735:255-1049(-)